MKNFAWSIINNDRDTTGFDFEKKNHRQICNYTVKIRTIKNSNIITFFLIIGWQIVCNDPPPAQKKKKYSTLTIVGIRFGYDFFTIDTLLTIIYITDDHIISISKSQ